MSWHNILTFFYLVGSIFSLSLIFVSSPCSLLLPLSLYFDNFFSRSGMFEEDPMLITQPSWPAASPSLVTTSKSHHCRVLSTTTTTVAFSQPPQQLSRFVNHCNLRHVLSTTAIIIVAPSTVRFSFLFF